MPAPPSPSTFLISKRSIFFKFVSIRIAGSANAGASSGWKSSTALASVAHYLRAGNVTARAGSPGRESSRTRAQDQIERDFMSRLAVVGTGIADPRRGIRLLSDRPPMSCRPGLSAIRTEFFDFRSRWTSRLFPLPKYAQTRLSTRHPPE